MYSVVDIGKNQYVKSKFKVFHKISVHVVYFPHIPAVVVYSQLWYAVDQAYPIHFQLKANVSVNSVKKFADLINTISGPN